MGSTAPSSSTFEEATALLAGSLLAALLAVLAELAALPLIMPRRLSVQSELANWFGSEYLHLNVRFTSNLSTNAAVMVRQGLGYALVIQGSLPFCNEQEIVFRPLSPAQGASSVLAWRRQQPFPLAAAKFISFAKDAFKA